MAETPKKTKNETSKKKGATETKVECDITQLLHTPSKYETRIPNKDTKVVLPIHRYAKETLKNDIVYAHNSRYNPNYPLPKKKYSENRVKLSIIGNRVTKEFIYCSQIIRGLCKYRPKIFAPPTIRGVSGVEWPEILHQIKLEYGGQAYCSEKQVRVFINNDVIGDDSDLKKFIESDFVYFLCLDYYQLSVEEFAKFISSPKRPCAYMHITMNNLHIGSFIFMLYADIAPLTCENFLRLCCSKRGGYSGTPIHRIVKDGWIQCGGFNLKESNLTCENFIVRHDRRGVLCMANDGRHCKCSTQFFILLQPAPWMADKYVAFGQLIDGGHLLDTIENLPTFYESPISTLNIVDAGVVNLECHGISINKGANEYIQGHIEDLNDLGKTFLRLLFDRVWLEIEFRKIMSLEARGEEEEKLSVRDSARLTDDKGHRKLIDSGSTGPLFVEIIGEAYAQWKKCKRFPYKIVPKIFFRRFMRDKEAVQEGLVEEQMPEEQQGEETESYWQPEEYHYKQASLQIQPAAVVPFYIPLTDVPYPGEVSSEYDLKKFLRGDYCLAADIQNPDLSLDTTSEQNKEQQKRLSPVPLLAEENDSTDSYDSDDNKEIQAYLQRYTDRVSFAGAAVKHMAKHNEAIETARNEAINAENIRKVR